MLPALVTSVLPPRVVDDRRLRHAVVRVPAEDRVDAGDARRELQVDVHPVVRQQHDRLRALAAHFVDDLLQRLFLDAERPFRNEVARIGDRRVRKRLPDDRDRHAVDRADHVRREHRIAEVGGLHVLREEFDLAGEVAVDDLLDAVGAERELPVAGHHVDAEGLLRVDHVLAACVHSAVAEPCHVSPPSSSSAPGRDAFSFRTSVARCAKPPTSP